MRLTQSFMDNIPNTFNIKFSYCAPQPNSSMLQSVIFQSNSYQTPLSQISPLSFRDKIFRKKRKMVESIIQQNSFNLTNIQKQNNFIQEKQNRFAKLENLCKKNISHQIQQISIEDFQIGQLMGKGCYGNVYQVRHKQTGFFCALKKIKKKAVKDINQFIQSIKIHFILKQPNITQLYSIFKDHQHLYLLMELCIDGNLKTTKRIIHNKGVKQIKRIALGIAYGLRYLHRKHIRHGDIKLQNIVLSHGMPKITDFDCICKTNVNLSQRVSFKKIQGSPAYYSPEMLRQSELNLHDDVWSLGIIMYQLTCNYYPFDISSNQDYSKILTSQILPFPEGTDQNLSNFIRRMLSKKTAHRPQLCQVIKYLEQ